MATFVLILMDIHSKQDPAEINLKITLIPFTQEEINIALVGVEVDKNQWLWKTISMWGSPTHINICL